MRWIEAFLTGRRHRVSLDSELSDWVYVKSGIPQGSVLGPILFVVFINDMPRVIKNCCKLFADDAKIYSAIQSEDDTVFWGPHFVGDITAVERVKKRATRMIPSFKNLSYRKRLEILNMPSLSYRRKRGSMIMNYKIMTKK